MDRLVRDDRKAKKKQDTAQMSFICHIHNYTEYNQQCCSLCTHTWSSGQPTRRRSGSSWGFGALLKGLTSVVDNSYRSRDSNPKPRVTSPTLYPLGHDCPPWVTQITVVELITVTQITTHYNQGIQTTISEHIKYRTLKQMGSSSRRLHGGYNSHRITKIGQ